MGAEHSGSEGSPSFLLNVSNAGMTEFALLMSPYVHNLSNPKVTQFE